MAAASTLTNGLLGGEGRLTVRKAWIVASVAISSALAFLMLLVVGVYVVAGNLANGVGGGVTAAWLSGKPGSAARTTDGRLGDGITEWVQEHCTPVPRERWQSEPTDKEADNAGATGGMLVGSVLYDCGGKAR